MAESAALRREIRRRKILDNSEARLKKIFGNGNLKTVVETVPEKSILSDLLCDDDELNDYVGNGINQNTDCETSRVSNPLEFSSEEHWPRGVLGSNVNGEVKSTSVSNLRDYEFPKKVSDTESRSYCRSKSDCHRRNSCTQIVMDTLQIYELSLPIVRTWLVILLAVITRCWMALDNGTLFYQSILIPFFTVEIWILCYSQLNKKVVRNSNSLIGGILILCRVKASVAEKISQQLTFMRQIAQDFSLYIFFFILCHISCQRWI